MSIGHLKPAAGRYQVQLSAERSGGWLKWLFILPPLLIYALFVLIPIFQLAGLSLVEWDWISPLKFVGFANYQEILNDELFWLSIRHNLQWMIAALTIPTSVGLCLAILVARTRAPGSSLFQAIYFLPQMISSVIVAITWRWIYYPRTGPLNIALTNIGLEELSRGWLGTQETVLPALFIAHTWVAYGFSMLIFQAAIQGINEEQFDAAKIDGAGWFGEIYYVLLPSIRPALVTVFTVTAIWSFQVFDLIILTTRGGPAYASLVLALKIYQETFTYLHVGTGAALAMILLVIVLLFSIVILVLRRKQ